MFALIRAIEVLGEAAGRVSNEVQQACPEIPWREAIGIRNRLIHAYFDVNRDVLWKTAKDSLPQLLRQLDAVLAR